MALRGALRGTQGKANKAFWCKEGFHELLPKEGEESVKKRTRRRGTPMSWPTDEHNRVWHLAESAKHDPDGKWILSPWTGNRIIGAPFNRAHFYAHCDRMIANDSKEAKEREEKEAAEKKEKLKKEANKRKFEQMLGGKFVNTPASSQSGPEEPGPCPPAAGSIEALRVPQDLEDCKGIDYYTMIEKYNSSSSASEADPVDVLALFKLFEIDSHKIRDYTAEDLKAAVVNRSDP